MNQRKKLTDILNGDRDTLKKQWSEAKAADDYGTPLPPGEYVAHVIEGELFTSTKKNTAGYKLAFKVIEGEHTGRRFWHDLWLTAAALPMAKRDLAKIGVNDLDQLEQPLPRGIRCTVKLALRRDDDGNESNRVRTFEVIGIDEPEADPFAPVSNPTPPPTPPDLTANAERQGVTP